MGGGYGDIAESGVPNAVQRAIDLGVNCFDTAPAYGGGNSELVLGKALGQRRKDVLLVTKCGMGGQDRPKGRDSRRESILSSIDQSLQRLQTDYVDVFLIHWPDVNTPFDESMRALDDVVQQGKARFVGLSNFTPDQLKECMALRRVDIVQYGLNMFDRRMNKEIFPYCLEQGIGVMIFSPLASGLLTGTFTKDMAFGGNDWRAKGGMPQLQGILFAEGSFQRNVQVVDELKPIAARLGKRMPHLALRWVLSNPAVSVPLMGIRAVEEVEDNMGVLGWTLTDADIAEIDGVFAKHGVDTSPDVWVE
jgi:aryl-alcohol dehydrogenase-like predicted oxidoreductase